MLCLYALDSRYVSLSALGRRPTPRPRLAKPGVPQYATFMRTPISRWPLSLALVAAFLSPLLLPLPSSAQIPTISDGGVAHFASDAGTGEVAIGPANAQGASYVDQGQDMPRITMLRTTTCNLYTPSLADRCDMSCPADDRLLIEPYDYGWSVFSLGLLEATLAGGLGLHGYSGPYCYGAWGCTGSGQLWVEDQYDYGGVYVTAVTPSAGVNGYGLVAMSRYGGADMGDLRLQVGASTSNIAFYAGNPASEVARVTGTGQLAAASVKLSGGGVTWTISVNGSGDLVAAASTGPTVTLGTH